jgi:hypothetical protein
MNHLAILLKATERGHSPWLINDDNGHWAVCDDGIDNMKMHRKKEYHFSGSVENHEWRDTPEEAIEAYAHSIGLSIE